MHVTKIGERGSCQNRQNDKCHPENDIAHVSLPFFASLTYPADKGKTRKVAACSRDMDCELSARKCLLALKDSSFRLRTEIPIRQPRSAQRLE